MNGLLILLQNLLGTKSKLLICSSGSSGGMLSEKMADVGSEVFGMASLLVGVR